jgi:phosphomannomutase
MLGPIGDFYENFINSIEPEDVLRMPFEKTEAEGLLTFLHNPFDPFMDDIIARLDMQAIRDRGMRIAFDPMHGSGTYPLMVILCTARVTVDIIHQNKDAYFGAAMPAPTKHTLEELARKVRTGGYDLGIAFDGDGDRVGIIDEKGRYVSANEILAMLYWYLHEFKGWKGPVVRNQSTTHMLDRIAESFGEQCHEVPVGFKHISSKIDETDAVLGGESSVGLTVRGHIFGKDSIYASCLFVEMLSATGMTTSQILEKLHEKYGDSAFLEEAFTFSGAQKARIAKVILEEKRLPDFEDVEKVTYTDGCKVYFKNGGFITCRFSGTEPLLRLMSEAPTEGEAQGYINAFKALVEKIMAECAE